MPIPSPLKALLILGMAAATQAASAESVGPRKIFSLGCHNTDGTCYVTLEGAAFGASLNCAGTPINQFRFDNGDTAVGRRAYASFLTAFTAGRMVSVKLAGCTVQGLPKLQYFEVR